jgi:hypothetical protein
LFCYNTLLSPSESLAVPIDSVLVTLVSELVVSIDVLPNFFIISPFKILNSSYVKIPFFFISDNFPSLDKYSLLLFLLFSIIGLFVLCRDIGD